MLWSVGLAENEVTLGVILEYHLFLNLVMMTFLLIDCLVGDLVMQLRKIRNGSTDITYKLNAAQPFYFG